MLTPFECALSVSLEELMFIAIVIQIFFVSDFWRLFMISFKYGLISMTTTFIFKIILTTEIINLH